MIEQEIEVRTPDGKPGAVLYRADDGRRLPGVLFLTDIRGIRPAQRQMAARLAESGYTVLMPNVFYRTGRPPMFDFPPKAGDERTKRRFAELTAPLKPEAIERDVHAYVDFLAAQESTGDGPMGVVGLCFSGALAMRTAAARPERIAAAASFHGGRLFTDDLSSPHFVLARVKARLYFGHAFQDQSMPQEAIGKLNRALALWGGRYESEIYDGARHGWTVPDSAAYNEPQAEKAFAKLTDLFAQTLR
jgi:carboxymethylenebutenolidase